MDIDVEIYHAEHDDIRDIRALSKIWDDAGEGVDTHIIQEYVEMETVLCARDENEDLVGVIIMEENADSSMHISRFFVHPDYQGHGIGSALLDEATDILDQGCKRAFLSVAYTNPAKELYERYDFHRTDSFRPPSDDYAPMMREPQ